MLAGASSCAPAEDEATIEEPTTQEATESTSPEERAMTESKLLAECEREIYATKGENVTARWEAAGEEERQRMCAQLRGEWKGVRIDFGSPASPDEQVESFRAECQAQKAVDTEGQEALEAYFEQAMSEGETVADVLSEAGYECTNTEIREMQIRAQQEAQEQAAGAHGGQPSGTNEAGQDISDIPEISPQERADRGPCYREYLRSLPPEERGPESRRVVAEANERGVSPFDVVGC